MRNDIWPSIYSLCEIVRILNNFLLDSYHKIFAYFTHVSETDTWTKDFVSIRRKTCLCRKNVTIRRNRVHPIYRLRDGEFVPKGWVIIVASRYHVFCDDNPVYKWNIFYRFTRTLLSCMPRYVPNVVCADPAFRYSLLMTIIWPDYNANNFLVAPQFPSGLF